MVTRALNFVEDQNILQPLRPPLSDKEFYTFLDSVGQIVRPNNLRRVIYSGGIEPSLRRVVWKHILNVYPDGMTGLQRMDYMRRKAAEYERLRDTWRSAFKRGQVTGELGVVTSMVQKDVLRTDRLHPFYSGSDDNQNITSLFNILTTYALNHPNVSYCQGMSDIASPLLVTMTDEAQAYICFCAAMKRLSPNFMIDGIAMTQKFSHLSEALQYYDSEFHDYLKAQQADDLLFCYRWLLLEMKREFAFEDSLRMLEVLWSSLPAESPQSELKLFDREFVSMTVDAPPAPRSPSAVVMRAPRETAYSKISALRRQSSSQSLIPTSPTAISVTETNNKSLDATKRLNQSLDENINRNRSAPKSFQSLDETQHPLMQKGDENRNERQQTTSSTESNDQHEHLDDKCDGIKSPTRGCMHSNHVHRSPLTRRTNGSGRGNHFKDLKERLAAGKKGVFSSIDKIENFYLKDLATVNNTTDETNAFKSEKIIKNFSEFRNLSLRRSKTQSNETTKAAENVEVVNANDNERSGKKTSIEPASAERQSSLDESSPDDSQDYFPMTTSITRELRLELDNLNREVFGNDFNATQISCDDEDDVVVKEDELFNRNDGQSFDSNDSHISNNKSPAIPEISYLKLNHNSTDADDDPQQIDRILPIRVRSKNELEADDEMALKRASTLSTDVFIWENPLHQTSPTVEQTTSSMPTTVKNPFFEIDFIQTLTPDEQNELDYDGEIVDECSGGKKSITPIRLVRKTNDTKNNRRSSKRNSTVNDLESSSSSDDALDRSQTVRNVNMIMKTSLISETNPFLMDIATTLGAEKIACDNGDVDDDDDEEDDDVTPETATPADEEVPAPSTPTATRKMSTTLPSPMEFGGGNPFLMFLCLTVLLQHRNYVMKNNMDYNEMAMHFDKMVRKHNVIRVLNQARRMYADYLKAQNVHNVVGCGSGVGGNIRGGSNNQQNDGNQRSDSINHVSVRTHH